MANILVLYDSTTGHTKKMAEFVAEGAKKYPVEVKILSVDEATKEDILWCDGIAVGSPTQMGVLSWKMKKFWDEMLDLWGKIDGKIGCAFSSEGGIGGGAEIACMSILTVLMNFGFLVFGITDYVGDKFTLHYGATVAGEPRKDEEIEACRRLGERLAQWTLIYVDGKKEYLEEIKNRKVI
ncbi:MAG: flavodoxin family protein [Aquificota bacterium]|nr:MAG: flavodoxin family protein [Aquificota bacterium]